MLNPSDILRGYVDTIILSQLDDEDGYGYSISRKIAEKTEGSLSFYEALEKSAAEEAQDG